VSHSYADRSTLSCPECGELFSPEIWLIIDKAEQPDLLVRVRDGTIHTITCPNGHVGEADAPLLLYSPGKESPLIFSPQRLTTAEQDIAIAGALLSWLAAALDTAWQDEWLNELQSIPREEMPAVLDGASPEAAMARALQEAFLQGLVAAPQEITEALDSNSTTPASSEDLEQALATRPELEARLAAALDGTADDDPDVPDIYRVEVARANKAQERYWRFNDHTALDDAIAAWERVLRAPGFATAPERFQLVAINEAAILLLRRYEAYSRLPDLDHALALCQKAVARTPVDVPERAAILNNWGAGLRIRYALTGKVEDLDAAINVHKDALTHTPANSPERTQNLNNLGIGLRERYELTKRQEDLDAAIATWHDAVAFTPADSPDRARRLNNLGIGLRTRYELTGQLEDLDAAIATCEAAAACALASSPERASILSNLGTGLSIRYARSGRPEDIDAAIVAYKDAISHTPAYDANRAGHLNNLALGLHVRYARMGQPADLDAAINAWQEALARTPTDSSDQTIYLTNLGNGLRARYARTGQPADLAAAITAYLNAVARTPDDSPDRAANLNNLSTGLIDRYARTGRPEDLEAAIAALEDTVALTRDDSPGRAMYLNNLGAGLQARYARTGRLEDLEAALAAYKHSIAHTSVDSSERARNLNNLGLGLSDHYARTGWIDDLIAAITAWQDAVAHTPADAPERARYLNNLGNGLRARYARMGQPEDLDAAIAAYKDAIDHTSADSPYWASSLSNLGNGLHARYVWAGREEDLDAAIAAHEVAVAHTPVDAPERPISLFNLGNGLRERYARTGEPADLDAALDQCRAAALAAAATASEVALGASTAWAKLALARAAWDETVQAAIQGHATLHLLDEANVLTRERLSWRREAQGLAAAEAYARARQGDVLGAVLALETGQASQINAVLGRSRDRALLEQLRDEDPSLFDVYETAADEARAAQRTAGGVWGDTTSAWPDAADIRNRATAAQTALNAVVAEISARPGYESLLAPAAFDDVAAGVVNTPLAYLVTTTAGSLALLLHRESGQVVVEVLWANLTNDQLERMLVRGSVIGNVGPIAGGLWLGQMAGVGLGRELAAVLPTLGEMLMAPLAVRLRELGAAAVTIIPSGRLNLLPLHAASYEIDGAARTFLDEFAASFAPSAQTIVESQMRAAVAADPAAALVVANPQPLPKGIPSLRFAREEAQEVAALLSEQAAFVGRVAHLYETEATLSAVDTALPGKRVFHFACHAVFDADEPLNSGLLMAGGEMLTLRAIRDSEALAGTRLAVLSACQTGLTDFRELPDEVIGLPTGFLAAGAAGVVGSLWPVDDRSTALLMTHFYRCVLAGDAPADALRSAQLWLRGVTWGELDAYYSVFLPRMTISSAEEAHEEASLKDPTAAAYVEPYHWAAFTFSGA